MSTKLELAAADAKDAANRIVMHATDPEALRVLLDVRDFVDHRILQCRGLNTNVDSPTCDAEVEL